MFTVLHVEHNRFYHVVLKNLIHKDGLNYISAKSPNEALQILEDTTVNLLVTGLVFEDEQGYDFIQTFMSGKHRHVPVIVLSSNDDEKLKSKLLEMGVIEYVNKNTSIERVKWYVEKFENKGSTDDRIRNARIAVLDENELELQILSGIFASNHVDGVEYFNDPLDFLMKADNFQINIIDFALPKISAEYVYSIIRKKNKDSIILALASISDESDIANIISAGADDYIMKPINEKLIFDRLNYAITNRALRDDEVKAGRPKENGLKLDGMTGLFHHSYLMSYIESMMDKYRYGGDLAVILFNIDGTKHVNNVFGYEFGDQVIIQVGQTIKTLIRSTDVLGRYGGEEFLLILPDTDIHGAITIAEKIREKIQQTDFGKKNLQITISGGVAEIDSDSSERLLERAHSFMRMAKRSGRNCIEYEMTT